jgi:hypothetical protein
MVPWHHSCHCRTKGKSRKSASSVKQDSLCLSPCFVPEPETIPGTSRVCRLVELVKACLGLSPVGQAAGTACAKALWLARVQHLQGAVKCRGGAGAQAGSQRSY